MKYVFVAAALLFSLPLFAQDNDEWVPYMAQYEKGVGSTLVNLSLKATAPMAQYPILVKAMAKINHADKDGLPEHDEWPGLYAISDKATAVIAAHGPFRSAGTFTYRSWRTDYYYVKDSNALRQALTALSQPDRSFKVVIVEDPKWENYLKFLYPTPEILESINNNKVLLQLSKAGDKLDKPRLVDHWLYFNTDEDRSKFIAYAAQQHFKVEETGFKAELPLRYKLHISRVDKVDANTITTLTLLLREKATAYKGKYDGWETVVVKD